MSDSTGNYIVPLGVDASALVSGVSEGIQTLEALERTAGEASGTVNQSFRQSAAAAETLTQSLRPTAASLAQLRDQGKSLGTELAAAMNGNGVGAGLEEKLKRLKDQFKTLTTGNNRIQMTFDDAQLTSFELKLSQASNEFEKLGTVIEFAKEKLNSLDPNSSEYGKLASQVELASGFLEGLGNAAEHVNETVTPLRQQLRTLRETMAQMELAGQGNTAEFREMSIRAGELQDQIGDVSARVRVLASDTKYLDAGVQAVQGLVGAFTAAQGAMALFGSENKELQATMQKVMGAMALLQGVQAIAVALNKDSALSVLFLSRTQVTATATTEALAVAETAEAGAATGAAAATNAFTASLLANPIIAVVAAIAAVVAGLIIWSATSDDTKMSLSDLNDEIERQNRLLKLNDDALKRGTDISVAYAKLAGKSAEEVAAIEAESFEERIALRQKFIDDNTEALKTMEVKNREDGKQYRKIQDDIADAEREILDMRTKRQVDQLNAQTEQNKKQKELAKKALEDRKRQIEEEKKISDQIIKFTQLAAVSRVATLDDGYAKERRSIIAEYKNKIQDVEKDKALSIAGAEAQTEAVAALTLERNKKLQKLETDNAKAKAELQLTAQQLLADAQKEGTKKELDLLDVSYEKKKVEINTQFKNEAALRILALQALESQTQAERDKINREGKQKDLKIEEDKAVALIELSSKFAIDNTNVEKKKQIAILQIKADFAQKSADALIASGKGENDEAVLAAKVLANNLKKELKKALGSEKDDAVSFLDIIGLGDGLSDKELKALGDAGDKIKEGLKGITDFIIDQYQRQIDKKQEQIDTTDKSIDKLQGQLDEEKDLQKQGLANNVEAIKADLAAKQEQKNEEVKQQEELLKKQTAMRRAQVAIDTAVQASNLITSATNIFSALSSIPFVGIPLAIATIALMVGSFVAARAKAFQAVNEGAQSFGDGGMIDGKSHAQGGQKYRSVDGKGGIVELEGGEYVINKKSTAKYNPLVEAINYDDFSALSFTDSFMSELLKGMGIHLSEEAPREAISVKQALDKLQVNVYNQAPDMSEQMNEMVSHLRYMAIEQRERPYTWEDGEYKYTKKGSKTIKKRITQKAKEDANTENI
jgi:hypothetical protein